MSRKVTVGTVPERYDAASMAKVLRRMEDAINKMQATEGSGDSSNPSSVKIVSLAAATVDVIRAILSGDSSERVRVYDVATYRAGDCTDSELLMCFICPRKFIATGVMFHLEANNLTGVPDVVVCGETFAIEDTATIIPDDTNTVLVDGPYDSVVSFRFAGPITFDKGSLLTAYVSGSALGLSDFGITVTGYWGE